MRTKTFFIETSSSFSFHAITAMVQELVGSSDLQEGVAFVFSRHTTTALIVNEMEHRLIKDIEQWLCDLVRAISMMICT